MIDDLQMMMRYFQKPDNAMYEDQLIDRYGQEEIRRAIQIGLLKHKKIYCGPGKGRCICWLSGSVN